MISFTTPGIILRIRDVGAFNRLYTVYTRDRGKLVVRAISIRKASSKLQGSMNPHALLTLYIIAQRRFTLGGVVIIRTFNSHNESLIYQWALQHIREFIDVLTQLEFHDVKLFDTIIEGYKALDSCKENLTRTIALVVRLDMSVLSQLGVLPNIFTHEGKGEFLKSIPPDALINDWDGFTAIVENPFSDPDQSLISLQKVLDYYGAVRSFMLSHDFEQLFTDTLLKDLAVNKTLR